MESNNGDINALAAIETEVVIETSNGKRKSFEIAPDIDVETENAEPNNKVGRKGSHDSTNSQSSTKKLRPSNEDKRPSKGSSSKSNDLNTSTVSKPPRKPSGGATAIPRMATARERRTSQFTSVVVKQANRNTFDKASVASTLHANESFSKEGIAAPATSHFTLGDIPSTPFSPAAYNRVMDMTQDSSTKYFTRSLTKSKVDYLTVKDKIQHFFSTGITFKEEKLATILSQLQQPAKGRVPNALAQFGHDKSKKYDKVVKELSDTISVILTDISTVRGNCVAHENVLNDIITDLREKFKDSTTALSELQRKDSNYRQEVLKLRHENETMQNTHSKLETECEKLKIEVKDLGKSLIKLEEKLKTEEMSHQRAENMVKQLQDEMNVSKSAASQSINLVKEEYNQRIEQSISGYKHEIASVRSELERKQLDLDRVTGEKGDLEKKIMDLQQEIYRIQSLQREAESAKERAEKEVEKLQNDINVLRDQTINKDNDVRSTLISLNDLQRQSAEEKGSLRAEISTMLLRIKALEEERLTIMSDLSTKREEYFAVTREMQQYKDNVSSLETKLQGYEANSKAFNDLSFELRVEKELRAKIEVQEQECRREMIAATSQLRAIEHETNAKIKDIEYQMSQQLQSTTLRLNTIIAERDSAYEKSNQYCEKIVGLESEIAQLKNALDRLSSNQSNESVQELSKISGEVEILRRRVKDTNESKAYELASATQRIAELEEQVRQGENQRRKLHNIIQELRGNIRVYARIRPFLPSDGVDISNLPESVIMPLSDNVSLRAIRRPGTGIPSGEGCSITGEDRGEEHLFSFDRVFGPSANQELVFNEVSEFVQSALDGFNVCLFSYGQTGSGKTHTMQGSGSGSMRGIIPRAMEQIGKYKTELESRGWKYDMQVCFVEIYNETIRDLLRTNSNDDLKHDIKKDASGATTISDVTTMSFDPNDVDKIDAIMELAARHRSVSQTLMNDRSSRSHSVFTVYLSAINTVQNIHLKGTLSLVDLAGSERVERSGASGARFKETVAINKSLSSLVDVFTAIANKQSHIPFRNSKLTYLLQSALSGDGKTLMLVNVSPTEASFYESLCSLRLAKQVNQCELGKPKRQCAAGSSTLSSTTSSTGSSSSGMSTAPISSPMASSKSLASNSSRKIVGTGPSHRKV